MNDSPMSRAASVAKSMREAVGISLTTARLLDPDPVEGMRLFLKRFLRRKFDECGSTGSEETRACLNHLWCELFPEDIS